MIKIRLSDGFTRLPAAAAVALMVGMSAAHAAEPAKEQANTPPAEIKMQFHAPEAAAKDDDPLEPLNRVTSEFNTIFRGLILDPLISGYKAITPDGMQQAIANAANNLAEPITAVSSFLQGDTDNAGNATKRFLVNSTVGVGGLGDPASDMGLQSRPEDLGQAFGAGGMAPGPHIVLPILGPSNLRDATGDILTSIANPLPLVGKAAQGTVTYSENQDAIKAATANSLDPYTTEKALYEQHRQWEVSNGTVSAPADGPTLADESPSLATKPTQ
ncbi:MAG: VacJ family lipoprotein [Rhodospirillales bacterium]